MITNSQKSQGFIVSSGIVIEDIKVVLNLSKA